MTHKKSPSTLPERVRNTPGSLEKINLLKGMITRKTMQEYESLKEEVALKQAIGLIKRDIEHENVPVSDIEFQVESITDNSEEKAWLLEKLGVPEKVNSVPRDSVQKGEIKRKISLTEPQTRAEVELITKKLLSISDWANTKANVDFVKQYKDYLESYECVFENEKLSSPAPLNFETWVDTLYDRPEGLLGMLEHPQIRRFVYSLSKSWAYITGTIGGFFGMKKHEHEYSVNTSLEAFKNQPEFKRLKPKASQSKKERVFAESYPYYADYVDRFDLSDKDTMDAVEDIPNNKKEALNSLLKLDDSFWGHYRLSGDDLSYLVKRIGGRSVDNTTGIVFNEKRSYEGKYINDLGKMVETKAKYKGQRSGYEEGGPINVFEVEGSHWADNWEFSSVKGFVKWLHSN